MFFIKCEIELDIYDGVNLDIENRNPIIQRQASMVGLCRGNGEQIFYTQLRN